MNKRTYNDLITTIKEQKPCFLIGNGINRFNQNKNEDDVSWEGLLLNIYNDISPKKRNFIPKGIALTEFFDILDLQNQESTKRSFQKEFADKLDWSPKKHHKNIIGKIRDLNVPVLTTNFDFVLQKAVNADMYRHRINGLRLLTDFYPWDTYFSDYEKEDPFNSFSIWHMHGQKNYKRSIKLGLNQYLLMVNRAKGHFPNQKSDDKLSQYQTWVRLLFEKDLIIFGLGLHEQEVFIRWLLLQRAKYFKAHPETKKLGFYINHEKTTELNLGKKFFLKSVGFSYVDFIDDHDGFYNDFWKEI